MKYTITDNENGVVSITIPTNTSWGTILFSYEKSNTEFMSALESKGLDVFIDLLVNNPDTAYQDFINGVQ